MERRWQSIATRFGLAELPALNDATSYCKTLHARDVLRFGAVGRGCAGMLDLHNMEDSMGEFILSCKGKK